MKPIVAIVGRPNVGKSTLFNRIAGKKISIVEDTPGVTRDRIYAEADWLRYNFTVIDTGGIETENDDILLAQMRRQAQIAIETANVIIFIVDGKAGLTDADNGIAQMLRKSHKPVVVAVNKIDNREEEQNAYEFYNMGMGEINTISANQGFGIGDLLDNVVKYFDVHDGEEEKDDYIRVAVIGRPNVGKSSLINNLLGEERLIVSDIPGTTRDSIDSVIESKYGKFLFIDTAGLRKKSRIKEVIERYSAIRTIASIERADLCILMLDASEDLGEQDQKIIGYAHDQGKAVMIVINKWDLVNKDSKTADFYIQKVKDNFLFLSYAPILFTSVKTGKRVDKILQVASKCYENYSRRIQTGVLNDVISKAVLMQEPPSKGSLKLRIYYATQVGIKPPTFAFFVNTPEALHFSYQRYLENQLRQNFDFEGAYIKLVFNERKEE